jgi:hypothetical protein
VTIGRFSEPARRAAQSRHPTIDLVDGEKLTDLCLEANIGVALSPVVNEDFFDRFEDLTQMRGREPNADAPICSGGPEERYRPGSG